MVLLLDVRKASMLLDGVLLLVFILTLSFLIIFLLLLILLHRGEAASVWLSIRERDIKSCKAGLLLFVLLMAHLDQEVLHVENIFGAL